MNSSPKRPAILWLGWLLQPWLPAIVYIAWYLWQVPPQWQSDSMQLYRGCRAILDWLEGKSPSLGYVRPYPLFQYLSGIPALWTVQHGILVNIYSVWCTCSFLSIGGILFVFYRVAKRINQPALSWASTVVMLSGPLLMYANCSFNEPVAALLILCFTAAVTGGAGPVICVLLFWLSGITKETAPALLSVIWLGTLWIDRSRWPARRTIINAITLAIALTLTLATNACFNRLRFGTIWNHDYLQPYELIRPLSWRAEYCLALWLSPSGGMATFWPTLVITMVGVMAIALRTSQSKTPAVLFAVILCALTFGLSGWYTPFGWEAWGPRLMLPWMPASLLILLRFYPDAAAQFVDRCVRTQRAFAISATIVCLSALPQVMAAAQPRIVGPFFDNDRHFPQGASAANPEQFHAWILYLAWQKAPPLLLRPLIFEVAPLQVAEAICFIAALLILLRRCQIQNRLGRRANELRPKIPG